MPTGRVTAVRDPAMDIAFDGSKPDLHAAVLVRADDPRILTEVQAHLDDRTVRVIAIRPMHGVWRGVPGWMIVATIRSGVRANGVLGYLKTFAEPSWVMIPLNLVKQIMRTFSLMARPFGNLMSGVYVFGIVCDMLVVSFGAIGPALAEGRAITAAMDAISRQPEASGTIFRAFFVGMAMIETMAIFCLVVALLLLFANPYTP